MPAPVAPGRPTGIGPAAVVAVIAGVVVVLFTVLALVSGGGATAGGGALSGGPVKGTSLRAMAGNQPIHALEKGGEPPADIIGAVDLPLGSVRRSVESAGGGVDQYDERAALAVHASETSVYDFFRVEMRHAGWAVSDAGPSANHRDLEVLGQKAGSDGWYWEMGAVVSPTTFANTSAGPGTGRATTRFTIRLFQVSDES